MFVAVGAAQLGLAPRLAARHAWPQPPFAGLLLNELRVDQPGTDNDEFFELAAPPGTPLDGLALVVIGDGVGLSGCVDEIVHLDGHAVGPGGLFLVGQPQMTLGTPDLVTPLEFENSDNLTFLLAVEFSGWLGMDLDDNDDGVLDATPWSAVLDAVAIVESVARPPVATEWWYAPAVGPGGNGDPPYCIRRCPESGAWQFGPNDPSHGLDSPGTANPACPGSLPCPADLNSDTVVDAADLGILMLNWGALRRPGEGGGNAKADLTGDGTVDSADLGALLGQWDGCGSGRGAAEPIS